MCEKTTFIPHALVERPDLLADLAQFKMDNGLNWRGVEKRMGDPLMLGGGSARDRWDIANFFACLERRRVETGSYQ